jgi:hypothetical protein
MFPNVYALGIGGIERHTHRMFNAKSRRQRILDLDYWWIDLDRETPRLQMQEMGWLAVHCSFGMEL